jgi:hypothetical protein
VPAQAEEEERPEAEELLDPMSEHRATTEEMFQGKSLLVFLLFALCCVAARSLC